MVCPVCKSGISRDKVIPIFTRENNNDPREGSSEIPNRPGAQRHAPEPNQNMRNGGGLFGNAFGNNSSGGFVMGLGLFPPLFTLNFTWDDIFGQNRQAPGGQQNGANQGNPEDEMESNVYRLLLMVLFFFFLSVSLFGSDVFLVL